jgi:hypothetical protein
VLTREQKGLVRAGRLWIGPDSEKTKIRCRTCGYVYDAPSEFDSEGSWEKRSGDSKAFALPLAPIIAELPQLLLERDERQYTQIVRRGVVTDEVLSTSTTASEDATLKEVTEHLHVVQVSEQFERSPSSGEKLEFVLPNMSGAVEIVARRGWCYVTITVRRTPKLAP